MLPLKPWLLAARPKTLLAGIVPVWLGSVLAEARTGLATWGMALLILASCLCIQIATNLFNDVIDFEKGADTAARKGSKRVTQSGLLSRQTVWRGAIAFTVAASLFAIPLILQRGWPILAIGIPSLYFSFGYTGGPFPLAYRGMGELFVILFFGLVAVAGTYYVQTGQLSGESILLGAQVGMLSTVLIAVNNLRDVEEDAAAGKRTLAVRFGQTFARREIAALCALPLVLGLYWEFAEKPLAFYLPVLIAPLALVISANIFRTPPSPAYNRFLGLASGQLLVFALMFTIGILR